MVAFKVMVVFKVDNIVRNIAAINAILMFAS